MQDSQENTSKIYIGNLPFSISEDELAEICQEHGEVKYLRIVTDRATGRSRGFAFAEFGSAAEAQAAIEGMHDVEVGGRKLFVKIARPKAPRS